MNAGYPITFYDYILRHHGTNIDVSKQKLRSDMANNMQH
jgi:hypothetical protein